MLERELRQQELEELSGLKILHPVLSYASPLWCPLAEPVSAAYLPIYKGSSPLFECDFHCYPQEKSRSTESSYYPSPVNSGSLPLMQLDVSRMKSMERWEFYKEDEVCKEISPVGFPQVQQRRYFELSGSLNMDICLPKALRSAPVSSIPKRGATCCTSDSDQVFKECLLSSTHFCSTSLHTPKENSAGNSQCCLQTKAIKNMPTHSLPFSVESLLKS